MRILLPKDLVNYIQFEFAGDRYRKGIFAVSTLKEEEVNTIVAALLDWGMRNKVLSEDGMLDVSGFLPEQEQE